MMNRTILIFLSLLIVGCSQEKENEIVVDTNDNYFWREEVEGADALTWVDEQN